MTKEMVMYNGKVFGVEVSKYGMEYGYLDYQTLSKIVGDTILNNSVRQFEDFGEWELVAGEDCVAYDADGNRCDLHSDDRVDIVEVELYQDYIITENGYRILKEYTDEIVYYNDELDMYVWAITHFGTGWDYVLTDIQLVDFKDIQPKWYSVRLARKEAEALKQYLREQDLQFEPSECGKNIHFEVYMTKKKSKEINAWIKALLKQNELYQRESEKIAERIQMNREVFEGWTVQNFIDEICGELDLIMLGESYIPVFENKKELFACIKSLQPYYKKSIPEVEAYFAKRYKL